jgi:hypothetical protein
VCACIPQRKVKDIPWAEEVDSCGPLEAPLSQCVCLHAVLGLGAQKAGKPALLLTL